MWGPLNFDNFANGLWVVIIGILSAIGIRAGVKRPEEPSTTARSPVVEVAAALIDKQQIALLIEAIGLNTAAQVEARRMAERAIAEVSELAKTLEAQRATSNDLADVARRLGRDMQDLREQLARSNR